ncbi:MAG: hypothetical protein WC459_04620 [Patescibacteria group bacterium]
MSILQKTLVTIAILAIASLFIFIFIIQPTIKDIGAFNDRIQIERVSLENKYTGRRNIKNIVADLKYVTDAILPLSERIIIQKGNEVGFISSIEKIAQKNDVVQKIKINPAGINNKIAEKQNLSITLSGDFKKILNYINELEVSDLYIIINSVNISSGDGQSIKAAASGDVKAYLEGYVYFSI